MNIQSEGSQTNKISTSGFPSSRNSRVKLSKDVNRSIKKTQEPTQEELCETILLIKGQIGEKSLEKAIEMMFDCVIKKKPPQKVFCDYVPPLLHIQEAPKDYQYYPKGRSELIVFFKKEEIQKTSFESEEESVQFIEKRLVGKSYVVHGENFEFAKQEFNNFRQNAKKVGKAVLPDNLDSIRYKTVLKASVKDSFRSLQEFLMANSIIKMKHLAQQEAQKIVDTILQEKIVKYGHVFKLFIRLTFGLSSVTLSEIDSVELYLQLLKVLYRKKLDIQGVELYFSENLANMKKVAQPKKSNALYSEMDRLILDIYRQYRSFGKVFVELKDRSNWSPNQCRQRIQYLLKQSLHSVIEAASKLNIPFPPLSEQKHSNLFQNILLQKDALDLRINLFDSYLNPNETTEDDLFILIEMTKQFIQITSSLSEEIQSLVSSHEEAEESKKSEQDSLINERQR